jgi:hypothetical protein
MLNSLAGAGAGTQGQLAGARPTRIIIYAWGETYLDLMLSFNLPALLAPGNLPYVAAKAPCQVVILTEERFFPRVASHPAVAQVKSLCDVRLVSLDDLIAVPDKYGMALSYVLHRGFADLGEEMTNSWQIFLNADFILADGSLRSLLPRLASGERIVASPSYCVNAAGVIPELRQRIDPHTLSLTLPPREMAAMVLRHRHNTIRGKTVNQRAISMLIMDQFYWEANRDTLLGFQMPIAVVGLRPQRYLREPIAYWDHGLIREFCPDADACVIGDSDEFLMLELRSEDTAANQLSLGWPSPAQIASRMIVFLTPYQREYLKYPLTLHAGELPANVDESRAKLRAFVDEVFGFVPDVLPSHRNHPQWQYHLPGYTKSRHDSLSRQLGLRTTRAPPPDTLTEFDQAWWRLDGLEKSYPRQRAECVEAMVRDIKWVEDALIAASSRPVPIHKARDAANLTQADREILHEFAVLAERSGTSARAEGAMAITLYRQSPTDSEPLPKAHDSWDEELSNLLHRRRSESMETELARLETVRDMIRDHYERRLLLLDSDYEATKRRLQGDYERLMPKGVREAGIPHIHVRTGAIPLGRSTDSLPMRWAKKAYYWCFGKFPRVTPRNPQWAPLRHVVRIVDAVADAGGTNAFVISSEASPIERLADRFTGKHARVAPSVALSDNFPLAFEQRPTFHLCLCILGHPELREFPGIVKAMAPCMRPGGKIVGFHLNPSLAPLPANDPNLIAALSRLIDPVRVHYAGSPESAKVLSAIRRAGAGGGHELVRAARIVLTQLRVLPQTLAINREEAATHDGDALAPPALCTSITLEVTIGEDPQARHLQGTTGQTLAAAPA